jgi:Tfp pilus assembly PilM family ATPase
MAKNNTVVGLDMGRHSVKAVWAEVRGGKPLVLRSEILPLPLNQSGSADVLTPWIRNMGLAKQSCVIGLSGEKAIFQPLLLAPNDPRTLEQAAAIEVLKYNEMASETMIYAFSPISTNPVERRLMLAMSRQVTVEESLASARALGVEVVDVVPSTVALFNSLEASCGHHEGTYLYINIGALTTELVIGAATGLMFARAFPSGGNAFTDALVQETPQLSFSQAEHQKLTQGSLSPHASPQSATLTHVAERWMTQLKDCLSIFQTLYPGRKMQPVRAFLAGGGSKLRGLPEYVASNLGIEAVLPTALPGDADSPNAEELAVAAGLAISGIQAGQVSISLLPDRDRHELAFRRQKPYWVASAVAAMLIIAVTLAGSFIAFNRTDRQLRSQQASLDRCQQIADEIESAKAKNDQAFKMARPVKNLLRGGPIVRDLITLVANAKAPDDSISMICDSDSYMSRPQESSPQKSGIRDRRRTAPTTATEEKPDTGFERIVIEGYTHTPNLSTVKALITKLKTAGFVSSADLLNDDELAAGVRGENTPAGQRFVIDVRIVAP